MKLDFGFFVFRRRHIKIEYFIGCSNRRWTDVIDTVPGTVPTYTCGTV